MKRFKYQDGVYSMSICVWMSRTIGDADLNSRRMNFFDQIVSEKFSRNSSQIIEQKSSEATVTRENVMSYLFRSLNRTGRDLA